MNIYDPFAKFIARVLCKEGFAGFSDATSFLFISLSEDIVNAISKCIALLIL